MLYFIEYFLGIVFLSALYVAFRYSKSRNKKTFFRSSLALSIIGVIAMLTVAILIVNIFFPNPPLQFNIEKKSVETTEAILQKEVVLEKNAEADFLNIDNHYNYIHNHFTLPAIWKTDSLYTTRNDVKLIDYYWDKSQFTERDYSDLGYFGNGLICTHLNKNKEALENYKQIKNSSLSM